MRNKGYVGTGGWRSSEASFLLPFFPEGRIRMDECLMGVSAGSGCSAL